MVRIADGQQSVKFTMTAGETKNLHAEFAWHLAGMTKDFGLVAHGVTGEVTLTHADGLESQSWPGADLEQTIPGSTIAPYTIEEPFTALDLQMISNEFTSQTQQTQCMGTYTTSWKPFSHKGDDRSAVLAFHRCPGKILSVPMYVNTD